MMALIVLSTTILPHHHHLSKICFAEELCAVDGQTNDEHTSHESNHQNEDSDDCPAKGVKTVKVMNQNPDTILRMAQQLAATVVAVCSAPEPGGDFCVRCSREAVSDNADGVAHLESLRGPPQPWRA